MFTIDQLESPTYMLKFLIIYMERFPTHLNASLPC